jgi:hypothetical protein
LLEYEMMKGMKHVVNDPKSQSSHGMRNELTRRKGLAEEAKKGL